MLFWLSLPVHSGSLKKIDYSKHICLANHLPFFKNDSLFLNALIFISFFYLLAVFFFIMYRQTFYIQQFLYFGNFGESYPNDAARVEGSEL